MKNVGTNISSSTPLKVQLHMQQKTGCFKSRNGSKIKFHRNGLFRDYQLKSPGRTKLGTFVILTF